MVERARNSKYLHRDGFHYDGVCASFHTVCRFFATRRWLTRTQDDDIVFLPCLPVPRLFFTVASDSASKAKITQVFAYYFELRLTLQ